MEECLVSIIVPVYNVASYLRRCVESLLLQSYNRIEIILIDDGSTDSCPEICDEYLEKDNRVKVIHKKNGGLSSARNAGIEISKGLFLSFVDSDDVVHPKFIERLVRAVEQTGKKMSVCLFSHFSDETPPCFVDKEVAPKPMSADKAISLYCELTPIRSTALISCCTKLYAKSLFETLRFPEGKIYEDGLISYKLIDDAGGVALVDDPLYGYYMRQNSIMGVKENHPYKVVLQPYKEAICYFEKKDKVDVAILFYPPMLMREIYRYWVAKHVQHNQLESTEILAGFRGDYKKMLKCNLPLKYKVLFGVLSMFPWIYNVYRKFMPGFIGGR